MNENAGISIILCHTVIFKGNTCTQRHRLHVTVNCSNARGSIFHEIKFSFFIFQLSFSRYVLLKEENNFSIDLIWTGCLEISLSFPIYQFKLHTHHQRAVLSSNNDHILLPSNSSAELHHTICYRNTDNNYKDSSELDFERKFPFWDRQ